MSVSRFYQIELEKLLNESEKISFFTKHPPTIGTYRERVLKSFLRQFIPKNLTISSGFVYDHNNADSDQLYCDQTKQVDCLIYDENNYSPFLKTEDFTIIEPASLYGGIEIKSQLTFYKEYDKSDSKRSKKYPLQDLDNKFYRWSGTLIDAIENIRSISSIANKYSRKVFQGVFAYSSSVNLKNFLFAFDNGEIQKQLDLKHLDELPTYICVLDNCLINFARVSMFVDEDLGFDPSQSEMTVIEALPENKAFPFQFFTNALKIHLENNLIKKTPHEKGLFTAGLGVIRFWGHHFDLNSD